MRLYLDDNMVDRRLVSLLRKSGHHVVLPSEVGLSGTSDPKHLVQSLQARLVLLTYNQKDFEELHDVVLACGGTHPGMLFVRADNDPRKDMSVRTIAIAIAKLEASGAALVNHFHVLNHWR